MFVDREAVVLRLKETVLYLSTCLDEERLKFKTFKNLVETSIENERNKIQADNSKEIKKLTKVI